MKDRLKDLVPANLEIVGEVNDETLISEMRRAAVYVQVSAHEGFGCSLAEAMLCEAVPVVTSAGAIPEVVGDTGIYVPRNDPIATANAVKQALTSWSGSAARKRVAEMFPLARREKRLIDLVNEFVVTRE